MLFSHVVSTFVLFVALIGVALVFRMAVFDVAT